MRFPPISPFSKATQNWKFWIQDSSSKGKWLEVLTHYQEMRRTIEVHPFHLDPDLFPPVLKACTNLNNFNYGSSIHTCILKQGLESFTSIGNSTMDFYIKCGFINSAMGVFSEMKNKDSVSWNVVIHGHLNQNGAYTNYNNKENGIWFFLEARIAGFEPNISTLVLVLQAFRDIGDTKQILSFHGFLIRSGVLSFSASIQNSLLSLYSESGDMESARLLFDEIPERDVVSWSVMIGGYVKNGEGQVALKLFKTMFSREEFELVDELTVVSVIKACTHEKDIDIGKLIHCYVFRKGFGFDIFVGNSLVDMYSKCWYIKSAFDVFNEMPRRNVVSWNSMLSGFVHNELFSEALALFDSMGKNGIEADEVTLVTLLQSCKNLVEPNLCKSIHSRVIRRGFNLNELIVNSLIDAYAKCNMVELAWKLFKQTERRDMISWSTMISAFSSSGKTDEAINLFREMVLVQEKFSSVTVLSLLEACAVSAELRRCKWAHGLAIRSRLAAEVAVATSLLDMYSKCGEIDLSRKVFEKMTERNIVSWSAMISAYGMNGRAREAISLFAEMESHGLKPNAVTILSMLSACGHGGLVEEGKSLFEKMTNEQGFKPSFEHYSCIVDMLGRAGFTESALDLIKKVPEQVKDGASVWGALLSACRNYNGNSEIGKGAVARVLELEPMSSAGYLLASNMYTSSGLWKEAASMRRMMREKGVKVVSGYSLVHVDNEAHRFVAGDWSHRQSQEVFSIVEELHDCMKIEIRNEISVT